MKVYIVEKELEDFSGEFMIVKVFDSKEKAESYIKNCIKDNSSLIYRRLNDSFCLDPDNDFHLDEWEVE